MIVNFFCLTSLLIFFHFTSLRLVLHSKLQNSFDKAANALEELAQLKAAANDDIKFNQLQLEVKRSEVK